MEFATMAAARFGYGPSPHMALPAAPADYMAALRGGDVMAQRFPILREGEGAQLLAQFAGLACKHQRWIIAQRFFGRGQGCAIGIGWHLQTCVVAPAFGRPIRRHVSYSKNLRERF